MSKLNVELLQRIKAHILEEPKRYNQRVFGKKVDAESGPPCGTEACLAGWAIVLAGEPLFERHNGKYEVRGDVQQKAHKLTGIPHYSYTLGNTFGTGAYWPEPYRTELAKARTKKGKARVAANYIDFIIKVKGDKE